MGPIDYELLFAQLRALVVAYGLRVVSAILIFLVGRWAARWLRDLVRHGMQRAKADPNLVSFAGSIVFYGLNMLAILAILSQLGIATTSLVTVLGAASLAVGLALQGSLSNFAAGILLVFFHPFRLGDVIEGNGITGIVEEIQLLATVLRTFDNRVVTIPNSKLVDNNIINFSARDTQRLNMVLRVDYGQDVARIRQLIAEVLAAEPLILENPKPLIGISELNEFGVVFAVWPWARTDDVLAVQYGAYERLLARLQAEEIRMPVRPN